MANDSEYHLLEVLSREETASQRLVARKTGLSVGMVNLIIKRLVKTGYIKVSVLDGRTVRYVLTPRGSTELARRSYAYLLHVVSTFGDVRERMARLMIDLHAQGKRRFVVYGDGDVADIASLACRDQQLNGISILRQHGGPIIEKAQDLVVLDCQLNVPPEARVGIDVLERISRATNNR